MIGIVVVSHSETLAKGILELLQQMVHDTVPIALAAGTDNPNEPIGTDPMKVMAAIEAVYSDDGVFILMDLGSALMSAEAAIEFLEPEQQEKIFLCEAPIVEGGLAAAVAAAGGGSIEFVFNEARDALGDKSAQLEPLLKIPLNSPVSPTTSSDPSAENTPNAKLTIVLPNQLGLHARPAARLVNALAPFSAEIAVRFGERRVNARSLNKLVTLGTRQGDELHFDAIGPDAEQALAAVSQLASENFGDVDNASTGDGAPKTTSANQQDPWQGTKSSLNQQHNHGIPASSGLAVGPALRFDQQVPEFAEAIATDLAAERSRLQTAIVTVQQELQQLQKETTLSIGAEEAAIFEAQRLMLDDPDLQEQAASLFEETGLNAEAVWQRTIELTAESYLSTENEYMRARAADLEDVGRRVLRHLCQTEDETIAFAQPSIVIAADLHPSDTAQLPTDQVLGILLERGGATSHSAILARALGIPAIVGCGPQLQAVSDGQTVGLDGTSGELWLSPSGDEIARLKKQRQAHIDEQQNLRLNAAEPAITKDGKRIEIGANISSVRDAEQALQFGAEGVGLFRTEFLFMDRHEAPSEEEQLAAYRGAAQAMNGQPVIIRTLDIGGDKPIPYLNYQPEENPFLGLRGIRFCLNNVGIFKTQLRALLRAGADYPIKVMLPMVSTIDEVRQTKVLLGEIRAELTAEGIPFDSEQALGIMIETPAAVLNADQLAAEVDFFSIGTNDLTQYVMAADRGNAQVAELVDPFQPAVLHAIRTAIDAAHNAGIWIGMCGEMAGDPAATELLVGMGLDELSMSAGAIPKVKAVIRALSLE